MRDFTRKLRQKRGASAVFALAIFLIAALLSFTMVEGALTAAQNAYMQHEEEQTYLSVTSAARLFCYEAEISIPFEIRVPVEGYATPFDWSIFWEKCSDESWRIYRDSNSLEVVSCYPIYDAVSQTWTVYYSYKWMLSEEVNLIQKTLLDMTKAIDQGDPPQEQPPTLTIHYPEKSGETPLNVFGDVKITLTMDMDYNVTADFSKDSPTSQNLQYYVTVTLKCMREEPEPNVNANPVIVTRNLSWTVDSVGKGRYSA